MHPPLVLDSPLCKPVTEATSSQSVSVDTKHQPTTNDSSSQPMTTDDSSSQPITTYDTPSHAMNISSFESLCLIDKNTSVSDHSSDCGGGNEQFANKYIQRISDSLDIWLNTVGTKYDHSEGVLHPPLHDLCVSQVQRSLFLSQLRSTLQSLGGGSGVMEMASSFRFVVSVSVLLLSLSP